eukprot:136226-Rhodomonas_salina.2
MLATGWWPWMGRTSRACVSRFVAACLLACAAMLGADEAPGAPRTSRLSLWARRARRSTSR